MKKVGYATLNRHSSFMGRRGMIYRRKKIADKQSDLYVYSIELVVPVYVKANDLREAKKKAKAKRKARMDKFNSICAEHKKDK